MPSDGRCKCIFINALLSARNLAATPFLFPVITEAPSVEKLVSFLLSIPASSTCATMASVIALALAELEFSRRLLAARNAVFALPVSGWTNFTNVTSCSLLDTSQTSSVRSPKHLAFDISSTNCAFRTPPMRRNISLVEPAERCLKYLISSRPSCWRSARRLMNFLFGISSFAIQYMASNVL